MNEKANCVGVMHIRIPTNVTTIHKTWEWFKFEVVIVGVVNLRYVEATKILIIYFFTTGI